MPKERGSVTLIGTLILAMFTVLLLMSFVKISKSMKQIDMRRDTYECMLRYRHDYAEYVDEMAKLNFKILLSYTVGSIPGSSMPMLGGVGVAILNELRQDYLHAKILKEIASYEQCSKETKEQMIAGLPYLHTGKLTRNIMGTTIPRPPFPIFVKSEKYSPTLILNYTVKTNLDRNPKFLEVER